MKKPHINPIPFLVSIILIIIFFISIMLFFLLRRNSAAFHEDTAQNTQESAEQDHFGITLRVLNPSATGLTLECTQSGGTVRGELSTSWYVLRNNNGYVRNLANTGEAPGFEHPIKKENITLLTIDWTKEYGALPSGAYKLILFIEDVYGEFTSAEEDYRTVTKYDPIFTIP